jgi:hypothetical protein
LLKNPKYTFYTIKSSLKLAYYQKPAILPYVLFLVTVAMLVGAQHHRTQF